MLTWISCREFIGNYYGCCTVFHRSTRIRALLPPFSYTLRFQSQEKCSATVGAARALMHRSLSASPLMEMRTLQLTKVCHGPWPMGAEILTNWPI